MMKIVVVLCAFALCVLARPADPNDVQLLSYNNEITDDGYRFSYETSDGQVRGEEGTLVDRQGENGEPVRVIIVTGAYSYIGDDGETYWVTYTADENGYHPKTGKGVGLDPNILKSLVG